MMKDWAFNLLATIVFAVFIYLIFTTLRDESAIDDALDVQAAGHLLQPKH